MKTLKDGQKHFKIKVKYITWKICIPVKKAANPS
jgi:hypothetical protein